MQIPWQARHVVTCDDAPHSILYPLHSTLYILPSTLYTYTPYTGLHTPHSTLHTLHFTLHTLHFALHTLHLTLYTPHSALCTLHSTHDTPHLTLYTPHVTGGLLFDSGGPFGNQTSLCAAPFWLGGPFGNRLLCELHSPSTMPLYSRGAPLLLRDTARESVHPCGLTSLFITRGSDQRRWQI